MNEHRHHDDRFETTAQAGEWDSRYADAAGTMWSGRPNGRLVAEASLLTPGRALDVGCGEGADAIWLAGRGWTVSAIDISEVAISRARAAAAQVGVAVDWVVGDVLRAPFPPSSFDLVSLQYPALPKAAGNEAVQSMLLTVRPGGAFLAVFHDFDDSHREHMTSRGFDPSDYVLREELSVLLGNDFVVERSEVQPRIEPPTDSPHIADVVLLARRR